MRDRFAVAAKARGITVRALLDDLSHQAEDAALMAGAHHRLEALRRDDPEEWQSYLDEGRAWEEGTHDPVVD